MIPVKFVDMNDCEYFDVFLSVRNADTDETLGSITKLRRNNYYMVSIDRKSVPSHIRFSIDHNERFIFHGYDIIRHGEIPLRNDIRKNALESANETICGSDSTFAVNLYEAKDIAEKLVNGMPDELVFTELEVRCIGYSEEEMKRIFGEFLVA